LHISLTSLANSELFPCFKQIFNRNDILKAMNKLDFPDATRITPPPTDFANFA
jgi:hypothetical protein